MITKTKRFTEDVLTELNRLAITSLADGRFLGILPTQLERGLYIKVNEALTDLGGQWNRKLKGHVFAHDPTEEIRGLCQDGILKVDDYGFYATPEPVMARMVDIALNHAGPLSGKLILEPSAGEGAIIDYLVRERRLASRMAIHCVELNPLRVEILRQKGYETFAQDFLSRKPIPVYSYIFMNPPFEQGQDIDHVLHAYRFLREGGSLISVMAAGVVFREDRKHADFRAWLKDKGELEPVPAEMFKGISTVLCCIKK